MPAAGEYLGPYELIAPLGEGGMGEVWRARDTRLDRTVAVKFSKAAFSDRFEREARAIGALNHPHICTLHDVGPNYLVMELVEGAPVKGPLTAEKAVEIAKQILDALAAAHEKGLTHRDLKPGNILLTKQGVKLLDFGLAKQNASLVETDATLTQALTGDGAIVGTLQYMSPEQLQGKPADARSDLFAFGCVLYELLSGKRAFGGESAASVIAAILERQPERLETAPPLERVIWRCLAKDPAERFQTARDLKYNLDLALAPGDTPKPRTKWLWPAVAAAVLAGGAIGWMIRSTGPAQQPMRRLQLTPPPGTKFRPGLMEISPDGQTLAFTAIAEGKSEVYLQRLDERVAQKVPLSAGARLPFWSRDGKSLAFVTTDKVMRYDLESATRPFPVATTESPLNAGTWFPDGSLLVGRSWVRGGTTQAAPAEFGRAPSALPDGRLLALDMDQRKLFVASMSEPTRRVELAQADSGARYAAGRLFWLRDVSLIAQSFDLSSNRLEGKPEVVAADVSNSVLITLGNFTISADASVIVHGPPPAVFRLTWRNRAGEVTGELDKPAIYGTVALSPDGRRAAVVREKDLVLLDPERSMVSPQTSDGRGSGYPVWSRDGSKIAFRNGADLKVYVRASDGSGQQRNLQVRGRPTSWSPDGRALLVLNEDSHITIVPFDDRGDPGSPRPWFRSPALERSARFSPDGRWVVYVTNETGSEEVFVQGFADLKGKLRLSPAGGLHPVWSLDGKEIYYLEEDRLMAVRLTESGGVLTAATPKALFPLPWLRNVASSPYDVAPDGRFLVKTFESREAEHLEVILNWRPSVQ